MLIYAHAKRFILHHFNQYIMKYAPLAVLGFLSSYVTPARIGSLAVLCLCVGCNAPTQHSPEDSAPASENVLLSPNNSLAFGRESAMYRHLSREWLISDINGIPSDKTIRLDLRSLTNGHAALQLRPDCPLIAIKFDVSELANNKLSVISIRREVGDCSTEAEDKLMAILADTRQLERDETDSNKLSLISYQDTLTLSPIAD